MKTTIKFNRFNVTDSATGVKARISYSINGRVDGRNAVTLYAKDYSDKLYKIFGNLYKNDSDCQVDYFEKGKVVIFENDPLYTAALRRAKLIVEGFTA